MLNPVRLLYLHLQYAIVEHYFVDGALHVCQTGGVCEAAKEWVGILHNKGLSIYYVIRNGAGVFQIYYNIT